MAATQTLGGDRSIAWVRTHMTTEDAKMMLQALKAAAERLEAGIAQAERD